MRRFQWPVRLNEKRLSGSYVRKAEVIEEWSDVKLISIKTEKGKITMTNHELRDILRQLDDKGE